eukprot:2149179-Pyramimonas_sp.AAC.1
MIRTVIDYMSPISRKQRLRLAPPSELSKLKVAVTGAGGYIGSHVVNALLQVADERLEVVGTVRDLNDESKYRHVKALQNAETNLTLVEADLLKPESLEAAFEGCDYVLHVASPFILTMMKPTKNPEQLRHTERRCLYSLTAHHQTSCRRNGSSDACSKSLRGQEGCCDV